MAVPPAWQGSRAGRQRRGLDPGHTGRLGYGIGAGHVVQRYTSHGHSCCRCADLYVSPVADRDSGWRGICAVGGLLSEIV